MSRHLQRIGNSYGIILKKSELEAIGLRPDSEIEILIDERKLTIERSSTTSAIEDLRSCMAGADPDLLDAVIDASCRQARKETMTTIRAERKK